MATLGQKNALFTGSYRLTVGFGSDLLRLFLKFIFVSEKNKKPKWLVVLHKVVATGGLEPPTPAL
jgi:hypothetical protein